MHTTDHVGFVVDKEVLKQIFLRLHVFRFPVPIITPPSAIPGRHKRPTSGCSTKGLSPTPFQTPTISLTLIHELDFNNNIIRGCIQNFRTGRLERELQMVQLSNTKCSYIDIFWVSLVSFAAITLCVASQRVFIVVVVVYLVTDSVRKCLDTPSYEVLISNLVLHIWEVPGPIGAAAEEFHTWDGNVTHKIQSCPCA
jgi:hypothetical protein